MSQERKTYTMAEFAALFGRKRDWAYKLKRLQKIKVIEGYGEIMVPASEAERILSEQRASARACEQSASPLVSATTP